METFVSNLVDVSVSVGGKILFALIVFWIGKVLIKSVLNLLDKSKIFDKTDGSVKSFALSFVKIGLHVILVISIIGILGVPMASIVTVLASAGVAIGLALQGALSNLAGGIMLMIFCQALTPLLQTDTIKIIIPRKYFLTINFLTVFCGYRAYYYKCKCKCK